MFTDYESVEILGKIVEGNSLIGYIVTIPDFGVNVINEQLMLEYIKSNQISRLVLKNDKIYLRAKDSNLQYIDSKEYIESLPVFYNEHVKLLGKGYVIGTVAYALNINSHILTSLILIGNSTTLAGYYSLAEDKNWIMSNTLDSLVVSKPIDDIIEDIGDKFNDRLVINTDSFIDLNNLDYYRNDNEEALRKSGYNVYLKKLSYKQLCSIQSKLKEYIKE